MTTRQGADGSAHLAYFDQRSQASFIWDGRTDRIEVSVGGYGEPVVATITAPYLAGSPIEVLEGFEETVRRYADTLPTYGEEVPA